MRPTLGAGAGFLKCLKHTPCLALRGIGIAETARRNVADAGIQTIGHCPWRLPAYVPVHVLRHPCHLVSAAYHIQGPVRNNRFAEVDEPATAEGATGASLGWPSFGIR